MNVNTVNCLKKIQPKLQTIFGNPWESVHIDFAGPFKGHMWLILVDTFTKWPEVIQMSSTSSEHTTEI